MANLVRTTDHTILDRLDEIIGVFLSALGETKESAQGESVYSHIAAPLRAARTRRRRFEAAARKQSGLSNGIEPASIQDLRHISTFHFALGAPNLQSADSNMLETASSCGDDDSRATQSTQRTRSTTAFTSPPDSPIHESWVEAGNSAPKYETDLTFFDSTAAAAAAAATPNLRPRLAAGWPGAAVPQFNPWTDECSNFSHSLSVFPHSPVDLDKPNDLSTDTIIPPSVYDTANADDVDPWAFVVSHTRADDDDSSDDGNQWVFDGTRWTARTTSSESDSPEHDLHGVDWTGWSSSDAYYSGEGTTAELEEIGWEGVSTKSPDTRRRQEVSSLAIATRSTLNDNGLLWVRTPHSTRSAIYCTASSLASSSATRCTLLAR